MSVLHGRAAIVTGASQGFGLAISRAYVAAGASVLMCARDSDLLASARREVAALADGEQRVEVAVADVGNAQDVRRLVETALDAFGRLHILVNNAGIYGPFGRVDEVDWEAWIRAIEVNLFGSVLMCREVLPHFREQRYGKIVQLSGGGATSPLPRASAYAASKAAVVRFAETLAEEVREACIDVNAIAPGALNTRLLEQVLAEGPERVGREFYDRALRQKREGGAPLERGADLAVFLASSSSDGITGRLISAIWDPWESLPQHRTDLARGDVYTLRRILPEDRGLPWGTK